MIRAALKTPLLLALFLATSSLAAPAKEKEKELKDLRGRIERIQKDLENAETSKSEVTDALKSSERAISQANRELQELSRRQDEVNIQLDALKDDAARTQAEIDRQRALLAKLLYQRYLTGDDDPLKLLLNQQDPNEATRQLHYYSYLSRSRAEVIQALRQNLDRLQSLQSATQEKNAALARIKTDQETRKRRMETEHASRQQVLTRLAKQINQRRHELSTLKRDEQRLTALIERLSRIVSKKHPPRAGTPGPRSLKQPDLSQASGAFKSLKGKLSLPLRGEILHRFGSAREDSGTVWKGIFIRAGTGEKVKAVAAGRVVFADWLRGFGNLLIIDHDDGFMSLYGNNEALYKQAGDPVKGGDLIAAAGNSGGSADSGLYFELRYLSRPFDPLSWISTK